MGGDGDRHLVAGELQARERVLDEGARPGLFELALGKREGRLGLLAGEFAEADDQPIAGFGLLHRLDVDVLRRDRHQARRDTLRGLSRGVRGHLPCHERLPDRLPEPGGRDGDLDLALAGDNGTMSVSKVYRNEAGVFTDIGAPLTGVYRCSLTGAAKRRTGCEGRVWGKDAAGTPVSGSISYASVSTTSAMQF